MGRPFAKPSKSAECALAQQVNLEVVPVAGSDPFAAVEKIEGTRATSPAGPPAVVEMERTDTITDVVAGGGGPSCSTS